MYPVLFHIGSFKIYTYGVFVASGFLAAMWFSKKNARTFEIHPDIISDIFFVILICALAGARILYVIINFSFYRSNLFEIFKIWNGGLVFFGGFIAAFAGCVFFVRRRKLDFWKTADIIAPGLALGHAIGRIGCFFAGCCYGRECSLPFAVRFTSPESLAPTGVWLHPTQIYSVISNLIIFGLLVIIQKYKKFNGMVFLIYVMVYAVFRSVIECFRGDFRGDFIFSFLSLSQGIGIIAFFICLIIFVIRFKPENHDHH